ncbi:MAG: pilus assembly protein PilM [Candidatus Omnitrophota bacterium]
MGNRLGIYFGKGRVTVVELRGKDVIRQAGLTLATASDRVTGGLTTQDGDQASLADEIKRLLKENKFSSKEAVLGLTSKDLFIRGFQIPSLPKSEISSGISFEARKYLPFKTEDLVFDYQHRLSKGIDKMDVFYVAATKVSFDYYLGLFKLMGIQLKAIESAGFALVRMVSAAKQIDPKQSIAFMSIDDDLDMEFSIVSAGFPCFSRDVRLSRAQEAPSVVSALEAVSQERLTSELRVSLGYFRRQFSGSSVDKIILVAKNASPELLSELSKSLGIEVQLLELDKNSALDSLTDLDGLKACAVGLRDIIKVNLSVDLLKSRKEYSLSAPKDISAPAPSLAFNFNMFKRPLLLAAALAGAAYGVPLPEQLKAAKNLERTKAEADMVLAPANLGSMDLEGLRQKRMEYKKKLLFVQELIASRAYLITSFNILPEAVKGGLWIEQFDLSASAKDKVKSLSLKGAIYLGNKALEEEAIAVFLKKLKESPDFMLGLNRLEIASVRSAQSKGHKITTFEITGN